MPLPKAAFQDDSIQINAGLHNDLRCIRQPVLISRPCAHSNSRQSLGKNFDLFAATTNVKVTSGCATVCLHCALDNAHVTARATLPFLIF
jgi:hypothetical protein